MYLDEAKRKPLKVIDIFLTKKENTCQTQLVTLEEIPNPVTKKTDYFKVLFPKRQIYVSLTSKYSPSRRRLNMDPRPKSYDTARMHIIGSSSVNEYSS